MGHLISVPPTAQINCVFEIGLAKLGGGGVTSLVFHRWRCVGKWSDFGSDSRDSGSLIGSPSGDDKV